jgi:hypothetical protein
VNGPSAQQHLLAVFVVDTDEKELTTTVEQDSSSRSKK